MIRPHCLPFVMAAMLSACPSSPPVAEVRLVAGAFDDLNAASAPLLDDLALAERAQGQANAETRAKKRSGAAAGAPAAGTDGDPCPQVTEATGAGGASIQKGFCLEDSYYYSELADPPATAAFRRGLAAIGSYTQVLLILAEGRNIPAATADARRARGAFRSIERTGRCVAPDVRGAAPGHAMRRR
jgi:hypothetical protein